MMSSAPLFFDYAAFDAQAFQAVVAMCQELARTLGIARILLERGRTIDLAGLDRGIGLLCAKALDMPLEFGRRVRPFLHELMAQVENFIAFLSDALPCQGAV